MSTPTLFNRYRDIAANNKASHRIVLDGGNIMKNGPKALTLWGRFVQACKDLFKNKTTISKNKLAVLKNFEEALSQKFTREMALPAQNELNKIFNSTKSLQARDVLRIIKIVSDNAGELKAEDEDEDVNFKAMLETLKQERNIKHQKTKKSDYTSRYDFNRTFPSRTGTVQTRLIIKQKDTKLTSSDLLNSEKTEEAKQAEKYVYSESQPNTEAEQLLRRIGVNLNKIQAGDPRNHFIAVYNSIVDDSTAMSQSNIDFDPKTKILQQQNLLKAMAKDPLLAGKILDYFDKITESLTTMRDNANENDAALFFENYMKLICEHNGFAKYNSLDLNCNFDQMLTVAAHIGFSRLADTSDPENTSMEQLAMYFDLSYMTFTNELLTCRVKDKMADETVYGIYQHIPKSMDLSEYSRCPPNLFEQAIIASKFVNHKFNADIWTFDLNHAIKNGIHNYMWNELAVRQTGASI